MRLSNHVSITYTDAGAVLLDERSGRYWQLNSTGTGVLRKVLDGQGPQAIADDIGTQFRLGTSRVEADVHKIIAELRSARLVEEDQP